MSDYIRLRNVLINGELITMPDNEYRVKQYSMFNSIWSERLHICEISKIPLGAEPYSYFFHHILEKRNYEQFALCKWNIVLLSWDIHNSYESNPDSQPLVKQLKTTLLEKIEIQKLNFDNDVIYETKTNHIFTLFPKIK